MKWSNTHTIDKAIIINPTLDEADINLGIYGNEDINADIVPYIFLKNPFTEASDNTKHIPIAGIIILYGIYLNNAENINTPIKLPITFIF